MVGFKARVQRTGFQVNLASRWREKQESPGAQEERERERGRASSFELSGFGHCPQAGWSNQSVCMV